MPMSRPCADGDARGDIRDGQSGKWYKVHNADRVSRASALATFLTSAIIWGSMTPQVGQTIAACTLRDMEACAAVVPVPQNY